MKQICIQCGCHFPEDFEQTLKPPCNFWGSHGISNIAQESKKKIWDWIFSMPADEVSIRDNTAISFSFEGSPVVKGTQFKDLVPNWDELSEPERKDYQRQYFKEQFLNKAADKKLDPAKRIN